MSTRELKEAANVALRHVRLSTALPPQLQHLTQHRDPSPMEGLQSGASGRPFIIKTAKHVAVEACRNRARPIPDLTVIRTVAWPREWCSVC